MKLHYSSEKNIQILISLLKKNNISRVIVSPGSANANFVISIQQDDFFEIYSCIDERSAAYMACGLAAESQQPVVICCTGATASRNYMPALTEAYYRKLPLVAITATKNVNLIGMNIDQMIDRTSIPNDISICSVEKDEKRGFHSSTSQLPVDFWTLHNIAELKHYNFFKYRNSDFFFAKYVVITESITDAQVIERLIEPQLGDLYYNVSVLNLDGVKNLQYPFFLLSDLGIPFTAVVDKDVFLPYKNGKLMDSRNSETFLPEYSNTLNRRNPVLNAVFNTEELKDKLEEYVNQSYTKFVNYIEKYNMLSMQYCLEMDLVATDKASELYYDHYNLLGEKRNRKSLLIERKDAIKDPTVLLEIFDRLNPSEYPFSFKKIKNILVKKIKTAIITQRQNMEVEE